MKKLMPVLIIALVCLAPASHGEVTGSLTATSDYILRGISQSAEDPALQASVDYAAENGFYLGAWGSSIDVAPIGLPADADVEVDLYGGWAWEGQTGFGLDVGLIHYDYPGASAINYEEVYLGLSYKLASVKYSYADDFLGLGGEGHYVESQLEIPLPRNFAIGLHAGFSSFDPVVGVADYVDYRASLARTFRRLTVEVAYTGTDENQFGPYDGDRVVVSLSVN